MNPVMSDLIDGLPDAIALRCLACVPYHLHPTMELVSRAWKETLRSEELYRARVEVNSEEDLLCVCADDPENTWQVYDPIDEVWMTLPVLPSKIRHLVHFGVVSTDRKLFVLGGGVDTVDPLTDDQEGTFATDEVWSYDLVARRWNRRAPMLVPRAMFACCVLDGKITVAGGFTSCRKSISQAEVYDPQKDVWVPVPDLLHTHDSACAGVVIEGKVHVMHRGLSTVQVLEGARVGWVVEDYGWLQGPFAVVQGALYVMSNNIIFRQEGSAQKPVASASEFRNRIGLAMMGMMDDIYIIGGVTGPDGWNWGIKPLPDVDVLLVSCERPSWRQAAPMTKCRGAILGCTQMKI